MGNQNNSNTEIDPKAVENAHNLWRGFTKATQITIIGVVVILLGMAIFLLN